MSSAMAPEAASQPRTSSIRLEGVEVDYTNGRPNKKLKLVITISGQEPVKRKIARSGAIAWNGNILCPTSSTLTVDVFEKRKMLFWKRTAHFETPLAGIDTSSVSLPDASTGVNAKLSFSGLEDTDAMKAGRIKEDAKAAREKAEAKRTVLDKLKKVRSLIDIIKPIGEAVSGIHPAIDAAFAGVEYLIEACEKQEASQKAALALTEEWDEFLAISERVHALKEREESRKAVERMLEVIADAANYICNHTATGALADLFSQGYTEKIDGFREKFAKAMKSFKLSLQVEAVKGVHVLEQGRWLDILKPALEAHFRTGEEYMCLKGTRTSLLRKASEWLRGVNISPSPSSATATLLQVFWLYGLAGSGKSSVANTVADIVNADDDFDLTCFFCKRDDPNLSNPQRFLPTLAYRIAQYYDDYCAALVVLLRSPRGAAIATSDVETQFKMLFEDLLPKMTQPARSHVVVIDALDECGTPEDQGKLAVCILFLAKAAPWVKIFITNRPVAEIHTTFTSSTGSCILSNINEEADTDGDIRRFTEANLELIRKKHSKLVLSSDDVDQLVQQAAGLFIWSNTLFKYVRTSRNPPHILRSFLSTRTSKEPLKQLYGLYEQVLKSAVNAGHEEEFAVLHVILGTIFVTAGNQPLSAEAMSSFLRVDPRFEDEDGTSIRNMTQALHAVLYEEASGAIRVYHPSFLDFLQMKLEDGFQIGLEEVHRLVFKGCMAELRFNICELQDSSQLNKDVPDLNDRISKYISEGLRYSSLFWLAHVPKSGLKHDEQAISLVSSLLGTRKFLFWLEVLSLLKAVRQGAAILRETALLFKDSAEVSETASDLERFVLMSSEAMESTPHIYLSAMSWAPEGSATQKMIAAQFENVHSITWKEMNRGGSEGHSDWVCSVAFSPNGQHVVSGSDDKSVRLWNAKTGAAVGGPLEGHRGGIKSVCFSPDGLHIASGSSDKTIRIWNVHTGAAVGEPLQGHSGGICSVAFSPNGQHVVSGSVDKTLRIWDIKSGTTVGNPLEGHKGGVLSVCYSPDGQRIASGSEDKTVRVWDARTGRGLLEPLRDHTEEVHSVVFSPDGQRIASCSDDGSIQIWDAQLGVSIGNPLVGHFNWTRSVAFSPDGRRIVSGSDDAGVRIWDVQKGTMIGDPLWDSGSVFAVAFSPDGERIASGSIDSTIRIWDARTGPADYEDGSVPDRGEAHRAHWNACCARMDIVDGWVRDGEKLLLWIPYHFRRNFKERFHVSIKRDEQTVVKPEVDLAKLYAYAGTQWTRLCEP